MPTERLIECASVRLRDDGVVHVVIRDGAVLDGDSTRELFATYRELGGEGRLLILSDVRSMAGSTPESRALASSDDATQLMAAAAVIVGSRMTRMMVNLFMRLSRPAYPTRLFNDEANAVEWLHSVPGSDLSQAS